MPIAKFQMPDGRIARFEVPEGTTPEQAQSQMQAFVAQQPTAQPPVDSGEFTSTAEFAGGMQPDAGAQGLRDGVETLRGLGALNLQDMPEIQQPPEITRQQQQVADIGALEAGLIGAGRGLTTIGRGLGITEPETQFERQAFQQLEEARPVATTIGEIAGEALPFVPLGLGAAGLATRGGQFLGAAGTGAAEAGLITRGRGADVGTQFQAAGIGGTVAGALDLALPVIGRIGSKIIRKSLGRAPSGVVVDAAGKPSQELVDALKKSGQSFDDITREAQDELRKKAVSPREAARKAFLESQGLDPTRAQMTRNAADFQAQQEAAKTSNLVREALENQEAVLTTRFNNEILKTGGASTKVSASVADTLTEKATKLDQEIGDLYKAARQASPDTHNVRFKKLTSVLKKMLPADRRAGGNISAILGDMQAKGILNQRRRLVGRVGVETAEDLRKLMNELYDPANPFGNMLLRQAKDQLDDDVFHAAGKDFFKQGRQAKAAFERELTRAKISKFDSRRDNLVRDILENKVDPDELVGKVVFSKRWRPDDLKQLKSYISTDEAGKQAFDDLRSEVLQTIKERSFVGAADEAGFKALSRDKLERSLKAIGDKKLSVLFDKEEMKFLNDMLQVSKLREPVRGTALGRGPSAQAIGRLEQKLRAIPKFGQLLDLITFDAQGRAVLKAKPTPIVQPALPRQITPAAAIAPAVAATQTGEQ